MERSHLILLSVIFIIALAIGGVILLSQSSDEPPYSETITEGYGYSLPSITSEALSYNNIALIDHTTFDLENNICTASNLGMNLVSSPCIAQDLDGDGIIQYLDLEWTNNQSRNLTAIVVYDGQLESGKIEVLLEDQSYTYYEDIREDAWTSNYLVSNIFNYTNLGAPDNRCQMGNTNNTQMYLVNQQNSSGITSKYYCFTSVTPVNATAFRISGNRDVYTPVQKTGYKDVWQTVNVQFMGNGLLNDNRSYYRIQDVSFNPGQKYHTRWTYTPKDKVKVGKFHILMYETSYGLHNSINDERYLYMDPYWMSGWNKAKDIYINTTITLVNASVLINVTYDPDMLSNFSDLRFYSDSLGKELGYWFHNNTYVASNSVLVWVNLSGTLSPTANMTIKMFYDNPSASTTSNIKNAFLFADDFNDASVDWTNTWSSSSQGNYIIGQTGRLNATASANKIISQKTFGNGYEVVARIASNNVAGTPGVYLNSISSTNYQTISSYNGLFRFDFGSGGGAQQSGGAISANTFYQVRYKNNASGNDNATVSADGAYYTSGGLGSKTGLGETRSGQIAFFQYSSGVTQVDWIFVRNTIDTEPTYTFGAEEIGTTVSVVQSIPADNTNTTDNTPNLMCNYTALGQNITSVKLNVYDSLGNLDYTNTESSLTTMNYNKTWTTSALSDGDGYKWECFGYGSAGVNGSSGNRTLNIDSTNPSVTISFPTSTTYIYNVSNMTYIASDPHLQSCWFSNNSGATNYTTTCNTTYYINVSDGTYTWIIYANDSFGNIGSNSVIFSVNTMPTGGLITLSSPASGTYSNQNSQNLSWVFAPQQTNLSNSTVYLWYTNGTLIDSHLITYPSGTNTTTNSSYVFSSIPDGSFKWNAIGCFRYQSGVSNCTSATINYTFNIDSTSPSIAINFPIATTYSYNVSNITYTITDANLSSCWFSNNSGVTNYTITCGANIAYFNSTVGSNTWKIYANDTLGNSASSSVTFSVNPGAPEITINSGTDSGAINRSTLYYNITISDSDPTLVNITLTDSLGTTVRNYSFTGTATYNGTFTGVPDGAYLINFTANDGLFSISKNVSGVVDTVAPSGSYSSPTLATGLYPGSAIWVNVSATDSIALRSINISLVGPSGYSSRQSLSTSAAASSYYYNFTGLSNGQYNYSATVYDSAGNTYNLSRVSVILDSTPPVINYEFPTPSGGSYINTLGINISTVESSLGTITIKVYYDNDTLYSSATSTSSPFYNLFVIPDGTWKFNATANDTLGNFAATSTRTVYRQYDNTNITACRDLYLPGEYNMLIDITDNTLGAGESCLRMLVDGIRINCNGHTIESSSDANAVIANGNSFEIMNCNFDVGRNGVQVGSGLSGKVINTNFTGGNAGVSLTSASINISRLTASSATYGVYAASGSAIVADNLLFSDLTNGIYLSDSNGSLFNTVTFSSYSGTNNLIKLLGSNRNTFSHVTAIGATDTANDGLIILTDASSNNIVSNSNFTTSENDLVVIDTNSMNNTFLDAYYGSNLESVDGTSQLIRMWSYTAIIKDNAGDTINGGTVRLTGSAGRTFSFNSNDQGVAAGQVIDYDITNGVTTNENPITGVASFREISSNSQVDDIDSQVTQVYTLLDEVKSTLLSRSVARIFMVMLLLIGLASSTGYFIFKMKYGDSVADIWKYFVMMIIWNTVFIVLYIVLSGFIMESFYPAITSG